MIRLELNDLHELMQLYQCAMQGKFSGVEDNAMLASPKLASAMDTVVDKLISEARASHNTPMVDMMEQYRQLQPQYPQYACLLAYLQQLQAEQPAPSEDSLRQRLNCAAKPLLLSDEIFAQLLEGSRCET